MSDFDFEPGHKDDFDRVYDLEDPRPYFRGLEPAHYRMPEVLASFLRAAGSRIADARTRERIRVLDFACGYGTIGALLHHRVDMAQMYAHFRRGEWRLADGRSNWDADARAFEERRRPRAAVELGGVDIASVALDYAVHQGFLDVAFHDDVVVGPPGPELQAFLQDTDLVVESGAVGPVLHRALAHLLAAAPATRRPWILHCPRPDVDWQPLDSLWDAHGYVSERCNPAPIRYRRPLGPGEREDVLALAHSLGREASDVIDGGYILVDLMLARPADDAEATPLGGLTDGLDVS